MLLNKVSKFKIQRLCSLKSFSVLTSNIYFNNNNINNNITNDTFPQLKSFHTSSILAKEHQEILLMQDLKKLRDERYSVNSSIKDLEKRFYNEYFPESKISIQNEKSLLTKCIEHYVEIKEVLFGQFQRKCINLILVDDYYLIFNIYSSYI